MRTKLLDELPLSQLLFAAVTRFAVLTLVPPILSCFWFLLLHSTAQRLTQAFRIKQHQHSKRSSFLIIFCDFMFTFIIQRLFSIYEPGQVAAIRKGLKQQQQKPVITLLQAQPRNSGSSRRDPHSLYKSSEMFANRICLCLLKCLCMMILCIHTQTLIRMCMCMCVCLCTNTNI